MKICLVLSLYSLKLEPSPWNHYKSKTTLTELCGFYQSLDEVPGAAH